MPSLISRLPGFLWLLAWLTASVAMAENAEVAEGAAAESQACAALGAWIDPSTRTEIGSPLDLAAGADVVLLGEIHDRPSHHRFQLEALTELHRLRPHLMIGFEMFPRTSQPALDRWIAGDGDEAAFLRDSEWRRVWGMDPELYLPLFRFARENRIPMIALDVPGSLVRRIGREGLDSVPAAARSDVGTPAAAPSAYRQSLIESAREHSRRDPGPFVDAQLFRDRAMAEKLAEAHSRPGQPLAVGIMGLGHVRYGWGVPHQLADLGIEDVVSLSPWDHGEPCSELKPGYADAVQVVADGGDD